MRKFFGFASIVLAAFLLLPAVVLAQSGLNGGKKVVTLGPNETIDRDYFAGGEIVEIYGTVNGDVYAAGGQVLVDGVINGDLIVGGGTVTVSGTITQDARVGGGQIIINGNIGRNLTVVGGNIDLTGEATVMGSVAIGGGNVTMNSPIGGNATIGAGNLTIGNTITGDLETGVGTFRLSPKAQIGGNVTYWSEEDASIDEGATIVGKVEKKSKPADVVPVPDQEKLDKTFKGIGSFVKLTSLLSTLVMGLLILYFYRNFYSSVVSVVSKKPLTTLGVGFAAVILAPITAVILFITIVGFPLGFILIFGWLLYLYLGRIFVMGWLGKKIMSYVNPNIPTGWALFVGIIVYYIVTSIPVIGWVLKAGFILAGLGAMLMACKSTHAKGRKAKIF